MIFASIALPFMLLFVSLALFRLCSYAAILLSIGVGLLAALCSISKLHLPSLHLVHAKLECCNSLFLNLDITQINRLQAIQNALARAVTKTTKHHHINPVLKKLHWLKIPERIEYRAISLTYNTLQSSQPSYLRQLFTIQPPRLTCSSSTLTLLLPSVTSSLKFSNRSIAIAVPVSPLIWNKLPPELRQISDPSYELTQTSPLAISPQLFHFKLKTLLCSKFYPDSPSSPYLPPRLNSISSTIVV